MKIIVVANETIISMMAPNGSTLTPMRNHWPSKKSPSGSQSSAPATCTGCSSSACRPRPSTLIATVQLMISELMIATQASIQLNVRLRWTNRAIRKKARMGMAGISQVIVVSSCSFISITVVSGQWTVVSGLTDH